MIWDEAVTLGSMQRTRPWSTSGAYLAVHPALVNGHLNAQRIRDGYTLTRTNNINGDTKASKKLRRWTSETNSLILGLHNATALHALAFIDKNHPQEDASKVIRLLLQHGALVNAETDDGVILLHLVCTRGTPKVALLMVEASASASTLNEDGKTPVHLACVYGRFDILRALASGGADIDVDDSRQRSSLYYAVGSGLLGVVKTLQELSADPHAKNEDEVTPIQVARQEGRIHGNRKAS